MTLNKNDKKYELNLLIDRLIEVLKTMNMQNVCTVVPDSLIKCD